jgi:hypothetical protein
MLERNQAYKQNAHKEKFAVDVFEDFIQSKIKTQYSLTESYEENWKFGDIKLDTGKYIEVKGQAIDPNKYNGLNFIEIGELTQNPLHKDGLSKLELILQKRLDTAKVENKVTNTKETLGSPEFLNVAITSLANGTTYAYVNHQTKVVYLYSASKLLRLITEAIDKDGIVLGAGKSHKDTLGVKVSIPVAIWKKENDTWNFIGTGNEEQILGTLRA